MTRNAPAPAPPAADAPPRPGPVVVVGAGTMGHGIAQVTAMAGLKTTLVDLSPEALGHARARIEANLAKGVARGKVDEAARDAALAALHTSADLAEAAADAAWIIEAVPEDERAKRAVLGAADAAAPADAWIASNTSSMSITALGAMTGRPERVIGLHFFNPVHIMALLEIVRGELTSDATLEAAQRLGALLGKTCIVVRDSPGFATSRLGIAVGMEAIRMVQEGVASAQDIDTAMTLGYRWPMGPLRLTDLVGLDVRLAIAEQLYGELGSDTFRPPQLLKRMVRAGKLGQKSGEGFYRWDD